MTDRPSAATPMKWLALLFGVVVCAIIVATDLGWLDLLRRVNSIPLVDKAAHFVLYGLLNLFIVLAVHEARPRLSIGRVAIGCSFALGAVAALEEVSQIYVAGRTFSVWDLLAGIAGILTFGTLARQRIQRAAGGSAPGNQG